MFNRRHFLVATAIVGAGLVSGCVTQQKYNSLQQAYNQLQAAYQGDDRLNIGLTRHRFNPSEFSFK